MKKLFIMFSLILSLINVFWFVFWDCIADKSEITYRNWTIDIYHRFDKKVDNYIQSIIEDYTNLDWDDGDPIVTINECNRKKLYEISLKYDNVEKKLFSGNYYYIIHWDDWDGVYNWNVVDYRDKVYTIEKNWVDNKYIEKQYNKNKLIFIWENKGDEIIWNLYYLNWETIDPYMCNKKDYKLQDLYFNKKHQIVELKNKVYKTYKDWKDYVLANLCRIIRTYNNDINCNNLYSNIDKNIVSYNQYEKTFKIDNVSYWYNTTWFDTKSIPISYRRYLSFFRPSSLGNINRISLDYDKTELSNTTIVAWHTLSITWAINLQIPLNWCSNVKYDYKIYYRRKWDLKPDWNYNFHLITADRFAISNTWQLYWIDKNWNLVDKSYFYIPKENRYFVTSSWDSYWKKATVTINEWVYLTNAGKYYFIFYVENELWQKEKILLNWYYLNDEIRGVPVEVIAWVPSHDTSTISLVWFDNSVSYYPNDTISLKINLKDEYWNYIYDRNKWINIKYFTWNSSIQFMSWNNWINDNINGATSVWDNEYWPYFPVKIRFTQPWLYPMKFIITYNNKDIDWNYNWIVTSITWTVMSVWTIKKIYISDPNTAPSDFSISCTNKQIKLNYICKLDNFSWCDPNKNSAILFKSENDNWKSWFLHIYDKAGNLKQMKYVINHIDKTPPNISLKIWKNWDFIRSLEKTFLANKESLYIWLTDKRPSWCSARKYVEVYLNNSLNYTWYVYSSQLIMFTWLFSKVWVYNIKVRATDFAWNKSTITKKIRIIPNNDIQYKFLWLFNTWYADGNKIMTLKFKITDSFGNVIYDRSDLFQQIAISSNQVNKEITNESDAFYIYNNQFSWWILSLNIVLYNKSNNILTINWNFIVNEVDPTVNDPYYKYNWKSRYVKIDENISINTVKNIINYGYFTWDLISINEPSDIKLVIPIENCWKINLVSNVKVVAKLKFEDSYSKKEIEWMYVKWASWYENMVSDLQNNWLTINWTFSCWDNIIKNLKIITERKEGIPSSKIKIIPTFSIYYKEDGVDWKKDINKKLLSKWITLNYWWVLVKWLFSNSSKWLYEMFRKWNFWMANSSISLWKRYVIFNKIIYRVSRFIRWYSFEDNTNISWEIKWIHKYNKNITIWDSTIYWKSLIYVKWWNIYINWNIRKKNKKSILTIVALKDFEWKKWKIIIWHNVTNIDAIIITNWWIFSYEKIEDLRDAINWNRNEELKNQLLIYGLVFSQNNTIWWSIAMNGSYVLPWWKSLAISKLNYYKSALYDLNFLRRYHYLKNKWIRALDPISNEFLPDSEYGTNPVIIMYDPSIKIIKPYWF